MAINRPYYETPSDQTITCPNCGRQVKLLRSGVEERYAGQCQFCGRRIVLKAFQAE